MATTGDKQARRYEEGQESKSRESKGRETRESSGHDSGDRPGDESNSQQRQGDPKRHRGDGTHTARVPIAEAMRLAAGQLAELLQREPASVSSLKASGDGWTADIEVVEVERVPDTTSVMASYRVQLDGQGNLLGYERTRRYARGQIDQRK
ncbi:gas vesicle protein GvpO [Streptomyces marispadix]|nr:gas vesicle protein [Streptomyces marispadix]